MWDIFKKQNQSCVEYRDALEELSLDLDPAAALALLRSNLPEALIIHSQSCDACQEASETFWASRALLAEPAQLAAQLRAESAAPWFATGVMAEIMEREMQARQFVTEWAGAVARFSSRLAWISALALIVGSTFLYAPNSNQSNRSAVQSADSAPPSLFDSAAAPTDDALASPTER
jgi:hypothetical protein